MTTLKKSTDKKVRSHMIILAEDNHWTWGQGGYGIIKIQLGLPGNWLSWPDSAYNEKF